MAFGDKGEYKFHVGGVPFNVDGGSREEAMTSLADMLTSDHSLLDRRADRLGLDKLDRDALLLREEALDQGKPGDSPLRGRVRDVADAADVGMRFGPVRLRQAGTGNANSFAVGAGRTFTQRYRGARQVAAQLLGDAEAAQLWADEDRDEAALFEQLDKTGLGMEDVGQIAPDLLAFVLPGAAAGVVPTAVVGATLGLADVQQEQSLTGRAMDAAAGAAGAAVVPIGGAVFGIGRRAVGSVAGVTTRVSDRLRVHLRGLMGKRGQAATVTEEALTLMQSGNEGMEILGRAALDRVEQIVRQLPTDATKGLRDEITLGVTRRALKESTETLASGVNVFNPSKWEKAMQEVAGQIGKAFSKTEHTQMLGSINILAREMQNVPGNLTADAAELAATALINAPNRAKPVIEALALARNPEVRRSLFDSLVDLGAAGARAAPAAAGGQAGTAVSQAGQGILQ